MLRRVLVPPKKTRQFVLLRLSPPQQVLYPINGPMRNYMQCPKTCQLCTVHRCFIVVSCCSFTIGTTAIDRHDPVVPPDRTIELRNLFNNSQLAEHNEGE
jgi:hypothetical protein